MLWATNKIMLDSSLDFFLELHRSLTQWTCFDLVDILHLKVFKDTDLSRGDQFTPDSDFPALVFQIIDK